jgi:UDP-N-acetyl-D-glucosamine dehydrogenase
MTTSTDLLKRIDANDVTVGILGLGYVGLPLAVAFARRGVRVIGFEPNADRVAAVAAGRNYIGDVADADLASCVAAGTLSATADFARLRECHAILICVPTPLDKFKRPDMSFIERASRDIGRHMQPGVLVSLESTTYPTTTENFMVPILERESGLKVNRDFWVCFSPERVDPGNPEYKTENTPKVVGGLGEEATAIAMRLYGKAIQTLHAMSSPREAEMVKILENTYRLINISLVNELALLCGRMGIDIWKVIEAAKTKPYGFQAFNPGPGIGGHCIPLDPFYLEFIAKEYNFDLTMIHTAGHIENLMAHRMTVKISTALNRQRKPINGSRVLFLGVAYKADIDDMRESPALRIMHEVAHKGGLVSYHDPHVPRFEAEDGTVMTSVPLTAEILAAADCVVVTTCHRAVDYRLVQEKSRLIVDLRNAFPSGLPHVYKL